MQGIIERRGGKEFTSVRTFSVPDHEPIPEPMFEDFLCSIYEEVDWEHPLQELQAAFFLAKAMAIRISAPVEATAVVEEVQTERQPRRGGFDGY